MNRQLMLWVCSGLLFFTACQKNANFVNEQPVEPEPEPQTEEVSFAGVDESLWGFFAEFERQGALRGIDIDIAALGITGVIEEIDEQHVAGTCRYNFRNPNHITIDETFWNRSSPIYREFVLFHELGHCYLYRDHEEGQTSSGVCLSIMRSGVEDCRDNYNSRTREAYLNELFSRRLLQ